MLYHSKLLGLSNEILGIFAAQGAAKLQGPKLPYFSQMIFLATRILSSRMCNLQQDFVCSMRKHICSGSKAQKK